MKCPMVARFERLVLLGETQLEFLFQVVCYNSAFAVIYKNKMMTLVPIYGMYLKTICI